MLQPMLAWDIGTDNGLLKHNSSLVQNWFIWVLWLIWGSELITICASVWRLYGPHALSDHHLSRPALATPLTEWCSTDLIDWEGDNFRKFTRQVPPRKCVLQFSFYRVTRMHSADYAVARCPSVCLSVCLSHAGIVPKDLNGYTYPHSPSRSPTILVITHSVDMFQWNTNRDLHTPYSTVLFRMTLSELRQLSFLYSPEGDAEYCRVYRCEGVILDSYLACTVQVSVLWRHTIQPQQLMTSHSVYIRHAYLCCTAHCLLRSILISHRKY